MHDLDTPGDHRKRATLLVGLGLMSIAMWQFPEGRIALYPFTILATWFHEMGHGLAALLTGSRFEYLVIFSDGSGYASILRPGNGFRVTDAIIAASGPLGPAIAGSLLIVASRTPRRSGRALTVLGAALALSAVIWVRSIVGLLVLPMIGIAILGIAAYAKPAWQRLAVQVLGVQACISVWRQFDYLFSDGGYVGGRPAQSDTSAIADALLLPYWFWGGAVSLGIVALLWWSIRVSFRR